MKILVADDFSEKGIEVLKKGKIEFDIKTKLSEQELCGIIGSYDGIIVRSGAKVTEKVICSGKKLKVIGRAGVGLDNVDVDSATEHGVLVMNTPGGNTISTAEHAMSMMLALSRNIPQADASMKLGNWERKKFMGVELFNKTLGVVGVGRIGTEVARRALAFGMKVLGYDPYIRSESVSRLGMELLDLSELLKRSDFITVHVPFTEETRGLISGKEFRKMQKGARIVNCSRGGIVDEKALLEALQKDMLAGAALDVFDEEPPKNSALTSHEKVIATPHLGASTEEAQIGVSVDIAEQIIDYLKCGVVRNAVNLPFVEPETFEELKPFFKLAEKMGGLGSQLIEGRIKSVKIFCFGEDLNDHSQIITSALLKGMLEPVIKENINYVNAPLMVRRRGIKVVESKSVQSEDYSSLLRIEVESDRMKMEIEGTLFGKTDPRIVRIGKYRVEVMPEGSMLVCLHKDVPGIVGQIGMILGKAGINIAAMTLGREKRGGRELTVVNIDGRAGSEVVSLLRSIKEMSEVKQVVLK